MILTKGEYSHDESMQWKDWRIYVCATTLCDVETCTALAEANRRRMARGETPCSKSLPANLLKTSLSDIYKKCQMSKNENYYLTEAICGHMVHTLLILKTLTNLFHCIISLLPAGDRNKPTQGFKLESNKEEKITT